MDKCVTVRYAHLLILLSPKYCCMCKGSAYVTIVVETTAAVYIIRFIEFITSIETNFELSDTYKSVAVQV